MNSEEIEPQSEIDKSKALENFTELWDKLTPEDQAEFSAEVLMALGYDSSPSLPGIALSSVRKMVKVRKIGPDEADIVAAPIRLSFKHETSRFGLYKATIKKWYRKSKIAILWYKLKYKYEFYMAMREINKRIKNEKNK